MNHSAKTAACLWLALGALALGFGCTDNPGEGGNDLADGSLTVVDAAPPDPDASSMRDASLSPDTFPIASDAAEADADLTWDASAAPADASAPDASRRATEPHHVVVSTASNRLTDSGRPRRSRRARSGP